MGKESNIKIKYRLGALPADLCGMLDNADETDMKVLAALLMLCDGDGVARTSELCDVLKTDKGELTASLKFWRGAGMLESYRGEPEIKSSEPEKKKAPEVKSAHRNGALERSGGASEYSSTELAEIMEKRIVSAQFIDEAQRIMGRIFRSHDTGIVVGLVDRLGFEEEAALVFSI